MLVGRNHHHILLEIATTADYAGAANRLGVEFIAAFAEGAALRYDQLELWKIWAALTVRGSSALMLLDGRPYCALMVLFITLIDGNGANTINHAIVIAVIDGDEGANTTKLTVVNGQGGVIELIAIRPRFCI